MKKHGAAGAHLAELVVEVDQVRKGTLVPINEEISELSNQITAA